MHKRGISLTKGKIKHIDLFFWKTSTCLHTCILKGDVIARAGTICRNLSLSLCGNNIHPSWFILDCSESTKIIRGSAQTGKKEKGRESVEGGDAIKTVLLHNTTKKEWKYNDHELLAIVGAARRWSNNISSSFAVSQWLVVRDSDWHVGSNRAVDHLDRFPVFLSVSSGRLNTGMIPQRSISTRFPVSFVKKFSLKNVILC